MAKSKEERYLEWLEREEESLGLDTMLMVSEDIDYARQLLWQELGYEPTEAQLDAFTATANIKYAILPDVGVHYERIEQAWGFQPTYRDISTGRFISRDEALSRIAGEE
jgi:hypothetical protein